jgi:hypothetical protein
MSYVGIRADAALDGTANALAMTIRGEYPQDNALLPLDVLVYIVPEGQSFPWERYAPPAEWKGDPDFGFDAYLGHKATPGISYAFYHCRRGIPNNQWDRTVLPLADFVCAYGQGEFADLYARQLPMPKNARLAAVAMVMPHYPMGAAVTRILVDDVSLVRVPGTDAELRSWWQYPDFERIRLEPVEAPIGYRDGVRAVEEGPATWPD